MELDVLSLSPSSDFLLETDFTLPHSLAENNLFHGMICALSRHRVMPSFLVKLVQDGSSPKSLRPWINPPPHSRGFLLLSNSLLLPSVTSKALNINLCYDIYF